MITLLWVIAVGLLIGALVFGGVRLYRLHKGDYSDQKKKDGKSVMWKDLLKAPTKLLITSVVLMILLIGSVGVPATSGAIGENTVTGQLFYIGSGTHIFPFDPRMMPFVTHVTKYDLRRQQIEIGDNKPTIKDGGVEAISSSPGNPNVYFYARGWAMPNPAKLIELHKKYGHNYRDDWVERVWISALKAVQGSKEYNYVGKNRDEFQTLVEQGLQTQLLSDDGEPLVLVSQLAVVDFGYTEDIDKYLNAVAQKEFERQQSEQQILINTQKQEAETIAAQTLYYVQVKGAEGSKQAAILTAEGVSSATKVEADGTAYKIKAEYEATAQGIKAVQETLARNSAAYLEYQRITTWNGILPQIWAADGALPLLNLNLKN
jgi:regulator of protease activity HflC (stomatin/prohibitin superfamily)